MSALTESKCILAFWSFFQLPYVFTAPTTTSTNRYGSVLSYEYHTRTRYRYLSMFGVPMLQRLWKESIKHENYHTSHTLYMLAVVYYHQYYASRILTFFTFNSISFTFFTFKNLQVFQKHAQKTRHRVAIRLGLVKT